MRRALARLGRSHGRRGLPAWRACWGRGLHAACGTAAAGSSAGAALAVSGACMRAAPTMTTSPPWLSSNVAASLITCTSNGPSAGARASSGPTRAAGGWMPSASASRSRAAVGPGDLPPSASTVRTCRPLNSAVRANRSAARSRRKALTADSPVACGACAHTRSRPRRPGLTSAYEPVRPSSTRSTLPRLVQPGEPPAGRVVHSGPGGPPP